MMGKVSASNQFGGMISMAIAGILAAISWRFSFGVYGLGLIVLILVLLYLPKQPVPAKKQSTERSRLNIKIFRLALGMSFLMVFFYSIPTNMAIYLQENQIATAAVSGILIALSSLGGFFGGVLLSRLKHLFGYYFISVQIFAMGIGFGALIPTIYNTISKVAKKRQIMLAMALTQSFMYLGQFMSPIILDSVARLFGEVTNKLIYSISAYTLLTVALFMFIFVTITFKPFDRNHDDKGGRGIG